MVLNTIKSPLELLKEVEEIIFETDLNYLDAIIEYGEKNNIEIEVLASLVKRQPTLKSKLEEDCDLLNLLEKLE